MFVDEAFDSVAAETPSGPCRKQRLVALTDSFLEPDTHDSFGWCGQRDGPVFAAFAQTANTCAGAEADIAAVETGEFRDSKPGLDTEQGASPGPVVLPIGCDLVRR